MTLTTSEKEKFLSLKSGRRKLLTDTQQQEVIRQFIGGVQQKVLAKKYGVSVSTIQKTIREERKRLLSGETYE